MPETVAGTAVSTYVKSWTGGDFDAARSTLHDDVSFVGPLGTANGIDECLHGLRGLKQIVESSEQRKIIVDGDDVCLIYDLVTNTPAGTIPTAGWFQVRDGRITSIRVFFDARPLAPPQQPAGSPAVNGHPGPLARALLALAGMRPTNPQTSPAPGRRRDES